MDEVEVGAGDDLYCKTAAVEVWVSSSSHYLLPYLGEDRSGLKLLDQDPGEGTILQPLQKLQGHQGVVYSGGRLLLQL